MVIHTKPPELVAKEELEKAILQYKDAIQLALRRSGGMLPLVSDYHLMQNLPLCHARVKSLERMVMMTLAWVLTEQVRCLHICAG